MSIASGSRFYWGLFGWVRGLPASPSSHLSLLGEGRFEAQKPG
jgi:hypothetical protein